VKVPKETTEELLGDIRSSLATLETSLPKNVDGFALSPTTKMPFKALWFRESLCWRMAQLSRSALECFENKKLASAILLTRASMETCAALWYLSDILESAVEVQAIGETDQRLMKLLLGTKIDTNVLPKAENVLNFVDRVDKKISGFRKQYERLSEFAHPNWSGSVLLFSKPEEKYGIAHFGENMRAEGEALFIGLGNLASALEIFLLSYNSVTEVSPEFVRLCEAHAQKKGEQPV
jgi:hypothetical protein